MNLKEYRAQNHRASGFGTAAMVALVTIFLLVSQAAAAPLVIQPGQDGFVTQPGSTADLPNIPADFFGPGSDPISPMTISVVSGPNLVALPVVTNFLTGPGCHTGAVNHHCYQQQLVTLVPTYDTVIQRSGGTIPTIGGNLVADIEFVHLSLKSASPLEVLFGGGSPIFFDVFVELDGAQTQGTLTLQREKEFAGTMDTSLPAQYKVRFEEVGGPGSFEMLGQQDTLESIGNSWHVLDGIPTLSEWGVVAMVLILLVSGTIVFGRMRTRQAA